MISSKRLRGPGANAFAFTIETTGGRVLGETCNANLALAMYRAALETYFQHQVVLMHGREVLPVD